MENTLEKPVLAWVKGMKSPNPKGRGLRKDRSAVIQSLFTRVIKNRYTEERLNDLLNNVSKRDELMFVGMMAQYTFVKPAPPKDTSSALNSEIADEVYQKIMKKQGNGSV